MLLKEGGMHRQSMTDQPDKFSTVYARQKTYRKDPKDHGSEEDGGGEPGCPCGRVEANIEVGDHHTNHGHGL